MNKTPKQLNRMNLFIYGVEIKTDNGRGSIFGDFYVSRCNTAPGWFVYGRNSTKYGTNDAGKGIYVMLCARPDVKPRVHPHYNVKVRRGWFRKRDAQFIADELNKQANNDLSTYTDADYGI